jgi:anti-sigma factor RsiW
MACKEYAALLADCALGQLPPSRESALMTHVNNCAACREALQRAQSASALVYEGMNLLVAGEPSPQFSAHLRARIADESPAGGLLLRRLSIAASILLCAALCALGAMSYLKRDTHPAPTPNVSPVSSGSRFAGDATPATSPVARTEEHLPTKLRLHQRKPVAPAPKVLVEPGQMAALAQYVEALQRYQAAGVQMVVRREDENSLLATRPIEIPPLQIQPIRVPKIQDATDSWQGF